MAIQAAQIKQEDPIERYEVGSRIYLAQICLSVLHHAHPYCIYCLLLF